MIACSTFATTTKSPDAKGSKGPPDIAFFPRVHAHAHGNKIAPTEPFAPFACLAIRTTPAVEYARLLPNLYRLAVATVWLSDTMTAEIAFDKCRTNRSKLTTPFSLAVSHA